MKSIKRLLVAILCLSLAFSCVLVQAEDVSEETVTVYGEHTLGLINALEIADYSKEELAETITRGEFYALLARATGYPETKDNETLFTDLKPGDDFEGYVKTLYKIGLITPTMDGRIKATEPISATEAVSLLVKGLGYSPKAEAMGGYPAGYLSIATTIDITDGADMSASSITKGMALELIYNALEADMMIEIPTTPGSDKEFRVEAGTNLINTVFGLEIEEGIIDGVDISRVSGPNDIRPFHMEINGKELNCEDIAEPFGYLGYHVKLYHKFVRTYGDKIIYIEITDDNEEYIFNIEDVKSVADRKMEAYEQDSDKLKNYRLKKAIPVVYNGVSTNEPFTFDMIEGKNGTVRLLDNNSDNTADAVFVEAYENYIASYVNKGDKLIYHKYDNTKKLVLDNEIDEPYVIIFDAEGKEIQPSEINSGNVLSVYHSAPDAYQTYIRVYLSKASVIGEIEEITDEDEIVVDGTTYEVTKECLNRNSNLIKVGADLVLYVDCKGYVAEVEPYTSADMAYGYIVAADMEDGLGGKARFMLYTGDDELVSAYAAKNIRIDGVRYANTDSNMFTNLIAASKHMYPDNSDEDIRNSVVRYALNASGEVTTIDTLMYDSTNVAKRESKHTPKNSFFAVKLNSTDMYRRVSNHVIIGQNVPVTLNSLVFGYPEAGNDNVFDIDEYTLYKVSETLTHGEYVEGWAFYTRENQIISDYIATPSKGSTTSTLPSSNKFVVVNKISKMMDPNGDGEITCLTVTGDAGDVKIPVKNGFTFNGGSLEYPDGYDVSALTVESLKQGDVVRYKIDNNGYLRSLTIYYRASTNEVANTTGYFGSVTNDFSWIAGYVYKSYPEGFYVYAPRDEKGGIVLDKNVLDTVSVDDCIFVYHSAYNCYGLSVDFTEERDNHTISAFAPAAAKSYIETDDDCSFVVIQRYSGAPYVVIEVSGIE